MDIITQREASRYIELWKHSYDLKFRLHTISDDGSDAAHILKLTTDLQTISEELDVLKEKFQKAKFRIGLFADDIIKQLSQDIYNYKIEELQFAMVNKSGKAYELLYKFNSLLRQNAENRADLAKLFILINMLSDEEVDKCINVIYSMDFQEPLSLNCNEEMKNSIVKFLKRIGFSVCLNNGEIRPTKNRSTDEVKVVIAHKKVWIPEVVADKVKMTVDKINALSVQLQIISAERQNKKFSDSEEQNFVKLQREYLNLLKEQDRLLKDFSEEDSLVYKQSFAT